MAVQRTSIPKENQIQKRFFLIDAEGKTLGRLAARAAAIIRGKNKPTYTPHLDTGDNLIIINAEKIQVTGNKANDKFFDRYSGYHSGLKSLRYSDMIAKHPKKVLQLAINRMIPKTKLGDRLKNKLYIYVGAEHPHKAQKPIALEI